MASSIQVVPRDVMAGAIDDLPVSLPLGIVIIDLDNFAAFNDAVGIAEGDELLATFEKTLRANLAKDATTHRAGVDEWVISFPGLSVENTLVLTEELRAHVEVAELGSADHPVTMSAGVAARPPHGTTGDELLRAADEALSRSKRGGRNRVGIYVEDKMVMKSNYYSRATLDRLAALSRAANRTEASLLREAADKLLAEYAGQI